MRGARCLTCVVCYLFVVVRCVLFVVCCVLLVVCCLLIVVRVFDSGLSRVVC